MLNLETIQTATIAQIKKFARANGILPEGDLRIKQVWIDAVTAFLKAQIAKATSPEAVATYKAAAVVSFRFVWRAFVVSCLLAIALGTMSRNLWEAFKAWVESEGLELNQPKAIIYRIAEKTCHRIQRWSLRTYCGVKRWVMVQTLWATEAVDRNAIQPAQALRQRLSGARISVNW